MEERYATEEQQIEAIKKFWKENGLAIFIGAAIGIGGLVGWNQYKASEIEAQEAASANYAQAVAQLEQEGGFGAVSDYIANNSDQSYADLAAMQLANKAIASQDFAEAAKQLKIVVDNATHLPLKNLASIRLARVQKQQGDFDAALTTLQGVTENQFPGVALELQGDIHQAAGNIEAARQAYVQALDAEGASAIVQVKLDNLAVAGDAQ